MLPRSKVRLKLNPRNRLRNLVLGFLLLLFIFALTLTAFTVSYGNNLRGYKTQTNSSASLFGDAENQIVLQHVTYVFSGSSSSSHPKKNLLYYPNWDESDVDGQPSVGYHSLFSNQQAGPDGVYDTLTEGNTAGSLTEILVPDGEGNVTELTSYPEQENWECCNSSDGDDSYVYLFSTHNTNWIGDLYSLKDPAGEGIINSVKIGVSVKFELTSGGLQGGAATYLLSGSTEWTGKIHYFAQDSYVNFSDTLSVNPDTGEPWTWSELDSLQAGVKLRVKGSSGAAETKCTSVWVVVNYTIPNYELDLEVQWRSVPVNASEIALCIYMGNLGASENLSADYWNGASWISVIPVLQPNGWNNATLTINGSVVTIRFKGSNETQDKIPDSWEIDVSLVSVVYEPGGASSAFLSLLGGLMVEWGRRAGFPPTGLILSVAVLVSISGLAAGYYVSGEFASPRKRRIKELEEFRRRILRALEEDESGPS